jgi:hypothetical protein
MIKRIFLPVFVLFSLATFAQQSTSSPYSFYGIGDIRFKGAVENRLMGGVAVFSDSIHINLQNPASYAGLKLSTLTLGAGYNQTNLKSYQGNDKAQRTTVDYMAIGLPLFKQSTVVLGLLPYSSVGYKISTGDYVPHVMRYSGKGGLNSVFAGYGYSLNKNFNLGLDVYYNFGTIETNNIQYLQALGLNYGAMENNKSEMSGISFKLGAMYQKKIGKRDLFASLSITPQSSLRSSNVRNVYSVTYAPEGVQPTIVDQFVDQGYTYTNTLKLPTQVSVGFGYGQAKKWMLGTEFLYKQSSSFGNRFTDINQASFENGFKYSVGGYYIPNYSAFSGYFKKVTYRAGFRYENTGLVIRNESIKDYAVTGGFGFPIGGLFSNVNLGVEYGKRGTAKANLVEENYTNVILSFSFNDKWFVRSKYD